MMLRYLILLSIFLTLSSARGEDVNLNCLFVEVSGVYRCYLRGITVDDNESQRINIQGNHMASRTDEDVIRVEIIDSTTPFIITEIFTTFENVEVLIITSSRLRRIQEDAFESANNLKTLAISDSLLESLDFGMFQGLTQLTTLSVYDGVLENVDEHAFDGLNSLGVLYLKNNKITALDKNVFKSLSRLYYVVLSGNSLKSLHGEIFANNRYLEQINLEDNRINALGNAFLDNLQYLMHLNMERNICVSGAWSVGIMYPLDEMRRILQQCFDNFIEPPPDGEVRRFIFELLGSLVIRDESGNVIVEL